MQLFVTNLPISYTFVMNELLSWMFGITYDDRICHDGNLINLPPLTW